MKKIVIAILVLGVVLGAGVVWNAAVFVSTPAGEGSKDVYFEVKPGSSFNQVARVLHQQGLITDLFKFRLLAKVTNNTTKIRVGEYSLNDGMPPLKLLQTLSTGKSVEHAFLVQEGINMYEIAEQFGKSGLGSKSEFLRLCRDQDFIHSLLGERLYSLEGYLFPETYHLTKYTGAKGLITIMVKRFLAVYSEVEKQSAIKWKRHQTVTLASIIEKETGAPEERPIISSVFHNRLKKRMRLQTDPTILYGILDETKVMKKNITRRDIERKTRYNTYRISGLPFGPIASPGKEALWATLNPDSTAYLYFVSRNDGTHVFSSTFKEHNRAVKKYQLNRKARQGKSWRDLHKKKK